ncbi:MAG: GerMN domain-containing protein [Tenericutes bacterium]|nr:GerMN domain-containing protein [Mycoplasmatota bacterium]MDD6942205.1 GerMN domain-containing protein [bacterium]MDY2696700.1 GerMN domain-containing protein [Bacilli bacterium]
MLRTKALRKIFLTTLTLFVLLTVFTITNSKTENVLKTNLEIEDIAGFKTDVIYLLNDKGLLVKTKILLEGNTAEEKINKLLLNLTEGSSNSFPEGLKKLIPKGTVVNNVMVGNNLVTVDFSRELLKVSSDMEKPMVTAIVYSILELGNYEGVSILVDGKVLDKYPNSLEEIPSVINKSIGINKNFSITSYNNINKVVIYYLENIDNNLYYVPVTKYVNDERDKIKIIVEELASSYIYESNLMSFLNSNVRLLDYKEDNDIMYLNFNDYLFDGNDKILEEVLYSLAYSVFDNYNVSMVSFMVNGQRINYVDREDNVIK